MNKYESQTIEALESIVEGKKAESRNAEEEMILVLSYIEKSGRWKENKQYEKSSFQTYLESRFGVTINNYKEKLRVYMAFPEEAKEFGVGTVAKVIRSSGKSVRKAKQTLEKIVKAKQEHKNELPHAKIEQIIQSNSTPVVIKHTVTDWKLMYIATNKALEEKVAENKELMKENEELREQVAKLKATVERLKDEDSVILDIRRIIDRQLPAPM